MKTARNILIALIVGALAAAIPLYMQLRDTEQTTTAEIERLRADLNAARSGLAASDIHSRLGLLASAVRAGDFAAASQLSSVLYDEAAPLVDGIEDADTQRRIRMFLDSRDEVTAALATQDPEVIDRLDQLFRLLGASL